MSLPIWAKGPVSGARKPILIGPDCACAPTGAASDARKANRTAEATMRMRVIESSPFVATDGCTARTVGGLFQARVAPLNGAISGTCGSAQRRDVRHVWLRSTARCQARLAPL